MPNDSKKASEEFFKLTKCYFDSIKLKPILHLPIFKTKIVPSSSPTNECCEIILSPLSCAILWIYEEYKFFKWIDIVFSKHNDDDESKDEESNKTITNSESYISYTSSCDAIVKILQMQSNFSVDDDRLKMFQFSSDNPLVFIPEKQLLIGGLGSILRFMIKYVYIKMDSICETLTLSANNEVNNKDEEADSCSSSIQSLLGYRCICLQACAEVSVWTKFCEVDIFHGVNQGLQQSFDQESSLKNTTEKNLQKEFELSGQLFRFEYHLRKPVKMHNIAKEQQKQKLACTNQVEHEFAEGPYMLLSDLIIYSCVCLFQLLYGSQTFEKYLPKTTEWYFKMNNRFELSKKLKLCKPIIMQAEQCFNNGEVTTTTTSSCSTPKWIIPLVPEESLYKSDYARYNPNSKVYTRQADIDDALESFHSRNIAMFQFKDVVEFLNWDEIPPLAKPAEGGKLPPDRRDRKCVQLSALMVEVMKLVAEKVKQNNDNSNSSSTQTPLIRIVDFCSGGGHVGILLAWLLPKCQIILVENNEASLRRAWNRIERMQLSNVLLYQQNVSYFDLDFQIGVALHACGQATDLVLKNCLRANASFCVCPCCYGSIQSNHMLHYPRSHAFQKSGISLNHYLMLAHTSDHTSAPENNAKAAQGKLCMQIIDSDRCHQASENGYEVHLKKFEETASPKCHVLIGKKI